MSKSSDKERILKEAREKKKQNKQKTVIYKEKTWDYQQIS